VEKERPAGRRARHTSLGGGANGGRKSGVGRGEYAGTGLLHVGYQSDVCDRGDTGDHWGDSRVQHVDQWGAAHGKGGGDVVWGLHIPCRRGDGDQIFLWVVMGDHGGESLSY
jgi:hypothetical protein